MKYLFTTILVLLAASLMAAEGTKIAYIDSETIMARSKATIEAQNAFKSDYQTWKQEAEKKESEIKRLQDDYEQRKLMLSEAGKKEAQDKITAKKSELETYVNSIFGDNGKAAQRNSELLEPILDQIQEIIKKIAEDEKIDIILDAASSSILWARPELDITQQVIDRLDSTSTK